MKRKLFINGIILSSCIFLFGCSEDIETLSVDLPPLPVSEDSNVEEDKKSLYNIGDYLKDNKDLAEEYKSTDVISSVSGYITQSEHFDVSDTLKQSWESNKHVSISRISHEYYFGFDGISFKSINKNINKNINQNDYYIVLKGILYNNNKEDVSIAILGDSKIKLNNIKANYDNIYHVENKLVDFKNTKNIIKSESSMPVELYYKLNTKKYNKDDINVYGDLSLTNLKEILYLQRIKYPEDLNESEKTIYNENYNILKPLSR